MTNTDYHTMETGRELDAEVAKRLGWKIENGAKRIRIYDPSGKLVFQGTDWPFNDPYPRYSIDLNAAITLPIPIGHYLKLSIGATCKAWYEPTIYESGDSMFPIRDGHSGIGLDKDLPQRLSLAICRAWLAWKSNAPNEDA